MERPPKIEKSEHEPNIEIEQKYLLDSEKDAKKLEEKVKEIFPGAKLEGGYSETSYYFPKISKEKAQEILGLVMSRSEDYSDLMMKLDKVPQDTQIALRLRQRKNRENNEFNLTFKASKDPLHDVERIEIETGDISKNFLEGFAANGLKPESIWHSSRRIYQIDNKTKFEIQNVTGYGWTAEIESNDLNQVKSVAAQLSIKPLSQKSLSTMYKRYKQNWRDYYEGEGKDRHFSEDDWKEIEQESEESVVRNKLG